MIAGRSRPDRSLDEAGWDCASVLSTLSNTENHPHRIQTRIQLSRRTGLPKLSPAAVEEASDDEEDDEMVEVVNKGVARNRNETAAEKKARKLALKQQRQMRRSDKKANRSAFSREHQFQTRQRVEQKTANPSMIVLN